MPVRSIHSDSFLVTVSFSSRFFTRVQEAGPWEAGIATRDHHTQPAVAATPRHFHLCWRTHHNMRAAGCCCCCSKAAVSEALGIVVAGCRSVAASCMSLGRGLEVYGRESSLFRGRAGIRAFCDDGRLRILYCVSGFVDGWGVGSCWSDLREQEEDEDCAQDDQTQDEPAGPITPGATVVAHSLVVAVVVATASHGISRVLVLRQRRWCSLVD
jgi:hypothetical protein